MTKPLHPQSIEVLRRLMKLHGPDALLAAIRTLAASDARPADAKRKDTPEG